MQATTSQSPGVVLVVRRGCLMTALARITLANRCIGTKLTFPAYTKDMERLAALGVWPQAAAKPGNP